MDFSHYWDTRIDANERFFNNYPHIANFAFSECQELWDYMEEERDALLARHNALVEAVKWERECECFDPFFHSSFTAPSWPSRHAESHRTKQAARAEVDRLIAAADCKGEG